MQNNLHMTIKWEGIELSVTFWKKYVLGNQLPVLRIENNFGAWSVTFVFNFLILAFEYFIIKCNLFFLTCHFLLLQHS